MNSFIELCTVVFAIRMHFDYRRYAFDKSFLTFLLSKLIIEQ